jgi:transposase
MWGMTLEEEVIALRAEVASLKQQLAQSLAANARLQTRLDTYQSEPPSFTKSSIKPSTPKSKAKDKAVKKPRRKRAKDQNGSRRRDTPTRTVEHRLEQCPDCGYGLRHPTLAKRRQVVELPPPQPVEVTQHQLFRSWCARCCKWHYAHVDLSGHVLGRGRMGVRIASLIAYLSSCMRMPVRLIREYLYTVHSLTISAGEIVGLLHRVAEAPPLKHAARAIRERVQSSRVVHADETGWRQQGHNGYVWSFSTPEGERLYHYNRSRAGEIPKGILGSEFRGVLCSDFYCGYNGYEGEHQRCWTHLLRDLHSLKEEHPDNVQAQEWARGVRAVYDEAHRLLLAHQLGPPTDEEAAQHPHKHRLRQQAYQRLVEQAACLGRKYAEAKEHRTHPCHALCKRLLRHQDELFQFLLVPGLASSNNMAERSVRPVVVSRKVSGGTQSPRGSTTRMTLASLMGTWRAKGINPFDQCLALLSRPPAPAPAPLF